MLLQEKYVYHWIRRFNYQYLQTVSGADDTTEIQHWQQATECGTDQIQNEGECGKKDIITTYSIKEEQELTRRGYIQKTGKYSYVLTSATNNRSSRHKKYKNCTY